MKVLLINPPWTIKRGNIWAKIGGVLPPLSLGYLAAVVRDLGADVKILDLHALQIPADRAGEHLRQDRYDWIGITATTTLVHNARLIAALARREQPQAKIVFGGVHPTVVPEEVLSWPEVDYVVRGEGEVTFTELVAGRPVEGIAGLSFRRDRQFVHNPPRELLPDLDALPFPAYDLLPVGRYVPALGGYKRLPAISVITSRGCSGQCSYCNNFYGRKVRKRSADNVIAELKLLKERYGIREIYFFDDSFTEFPSKVQALCERMVAERLELTWSCFARFNLVNPELLRAMKAAGCHHASYGIESGDPQLLEAVHKPSSLDRIRQVMAMTRAAGIDILLGFMLGLPGETAATMERTMQFALELDPDMVLFDITTPFPGTELFAWAKRQGLLKSENWSDYDLYTPLMRLPTVSEAEIMRFYSQAHRRFYLRPRYLARRLLKIRSYQDLRQDLIAFLSILGL